MDGGVMFGQIPKDQWQDWMPADRRNRVKLGLNCLLVKIGDRNFLIDAGIGPKHSTVMRDRLGLATSQLISALRRFELTPQDIDGVVLTSMHLEHAGGATRVNRRNETVPTFPRAEYFVQREALEEATSPTERQSDRFIADDFRPIVERDRMVLIDGEAMITPGLHVRKATGPGQGHQIVFITHGGEIIAFLGDLAPTAYHLQLSCIAANDRQPDETLQTKRQLLREAVDGGWLLVFSHGTTDQAGYLENRSGRLRLRPVQLD